MIKYQNKFYSMNQRDVGTKEGLGKMDEYVKLEQV
jgi:hypothetical protein